MKINDGAPAFPGKHFEEHGGEGGPVFKNYVKGMSLRAWLAGNSITYAGTLLLRSKASLGDKYTGDDVADICVDIADAILKRLEK